MRPRSHNVPYCRFGLVAVIALAHTALSQPSSSDSLSLAVPVHGYVAIPLLPAPEYGYGQYTVRAILNTVSAILLIDSGFNKNVMVNQATADIAGLRGERAGSAVTVDGKSSTDTLHLKTFGIDSLQFGPQQLGIGKFPLADGGIGAYFLRAYKAILDYSHNVLYLQAHGNIRASTDALKRAGDVVVPIQRVRVKGSYRAGFYVRAAVNGKSQLLLIDTGWGGGLREPILDLKRAAAIGMGNGTAHGKFKLGTINIETDFFLWDLSQVRKMHVSGGMPPLDGVIGCGFLKEHDAIIDFSRGEMYLRP